MMNSSTIRDGAAMRRPLAPIAAAALAAVVPLARVLSLEFGTDIPLHPDAGARESGTRLAFATADGPPREVGSAQVASARPIAALRAFTRALAGATANPGRSG